MQDGKAYSRLVGMLKVALPLAALVLLSMLFMVARTLDPEAALPYAQVDIDEMLRDPRLTAPTYSGVTREGDEVVFTAETAHPGGVAGTGARAMAPLLRLIGGDGAQTRVSADEARIDPATRELSLSGHVEVLTAGGLELQTDELVAQLDRSRLDAPGKVLAEAPQGRLEAGGFTLTRGAGPGPGQEVLVFNGGVKLLYQPQRATPAP